LNQWFQFAISADLSSSSFRIFVNKIFMLETTCDGLDNACALNTTFLPLFGVTVVIIYGNELLGHEWVCASKFGESYVLGGCFD
jgi:hypothetical protein